jgi:hypothetical protein
MKRPEDFESFDNISRQSSSTVGKLNIFSERNGIPRCELFGQAFDKFTEPLNSIEPSIYSNMPFRISGYSFMSREFMMKKQFKDTPAPTVIKYENYLKQQLQKDYKYSVSSMIDSQKGLVPEILKSKSKSVSFSWGSSK